MVLCPESEKCPALCSARKFYEKYHQTLFSFVFRSYLMFLSTFTCIISAGIKKQLLRLNLEKLVKNNPDWRLTVWSENSAFCIYLHLLYSSFPTLCMYLQRVIRHAQWDREVFPFYSTCFTSGTVPTQRTDM